MHNSTSDAACPVLVRSQTGESIARINADRTWSVKWNAVLDQAYEPMTQDNVALCAVCKVLVAGRDNFRTSDWDEPQPWLFPQFDIHARIPSETEAVLALVGPDAVVAYVNLDGVWSVDWEQVQNFRAKNGAYWGHVPLGAFCDLLSAAKDNFHTSPMRYR